MSETGSRLSSFLSSFVVSLFLAGAQALQLQPWVQAPVLPPTLCDLRLNIGLSEPQLCIKNLVSTVPSAWKCPASGRAMGAVPKERDEERPRTAPSNSSRISFILYFCSNLFIYFWLHWVFVAARGLSLVAASRGHSSLRCAGFLLQWLLFVAEHGL